MPDTGSTAGALKEPIARLVSSGIYIGTSSWKYEGWLGQLYDERRYVTRNKISKKKFQDTCLGEYAKTFKTVSVDAGYYQFPTEVSLKKLCDQVPDDFKFGFKVTDEITLKLR